MSPERFLFTFSGCLKEHWLEAHAADAWVIADRLRVGRFPRPHEEGERFETLQRLTRACYHLVHGLVREKNRFLSTLFLKFSAFVQQEPVNQVLVCPVNALRAMELQIGQLDVAIERVLSTVPPYSTP